MACDICGKTNVELTDLRSEYKTDDIAQLCSSCADVVNSKRDSLLAMTNKILRTLLTRFMRERKGGKHE